MYNINESEQININDSSKQKKHEESNQINYNSLSNFNSHIDNQNNLIKDSSDANSKNSDLMDLETCKKSTAVKHNSKKSLKKLRTGSNQDIKNSGRSSLRSSRNSKISLTAKTSVKDKDLQSEIDREIYVKDSDFNQASFLQHTDIFNQMGTLIDDSKFIEKKQAIENQSVTKEFLEMTNLVKFGNDQNENKNSDSLLEENKLNTIKEKVKANNKSGKSSARKKIVQMMADFALDINDDIESVDEIDNDQDAENIHELENFFDPDQNEIDVFTFEDVKDGNNNIPNQNKNVGFKLKNLRKKYANVIDNKIDPNFVETNIKNLKTKSLIVNKTQKNPTDYLKNKSMFKLATVNYEQRNTIITKNHFIANFFHFI